MFCLLTTFSLFYVWLSYFILVITEVLLIECTIIVVVSESWKEIFT